MVGPDPLLEHLINRLRKLNSSQLDDVERFVSKLECVSGLPIVTNKTLDTRFLTKDWPHAPLHRLQGHGTYIVTASTSHKQHWFRDAERLDLLEETLLEKSKYYGWQLEAWAVFSNHYHFVGHAKEDASTLKPFLTHMHADTAREINHRDNKPDRQVWYNYWETELTFEKSYLARLNYVHQNAVHHGLVPVANQYRWCSAGWFERTARPAQVKTICSFKTDQIRVIDDFEPLRVP